jgi:PAS domain S-box-containing protein
MGDSATAKKLTRPGASFARRYGLAFASVAVALLLDLLFHHFNLPRPFAAFALSAIAITFWYGGTKPGIVAVLLSALIRGFIAEGATSNLARALYNLVFLTFAVLMTWVRRSKNALDIEVADRTAKLTAANEELRRQKEQLDELFELSPDAVILTDDDFRVLRVNKEFTRMFGYTAEEVAGQWLPELIVPEELRAESQKNRDRLISGNRVELETIRQRKDGVRFDVSVVARGISLGFDQVGFYLIYRDITQRKKAERELTRSKATLLESQRLVHMCSWAYNPSSGMATFSPEMKRIYGIESDKDTWPTDFFRDMVHREDRPIVMEIVRRAHLDKTDYDVSYRTVLPDGSIKHVHSVGHPIVNESGELVEVVGSSMDVTEQWKARTELEKAFEDVKQQTEATRRSEERWRSVFENSAIGVALTDLNGRFLATNHIFQAMVGYTEEELHAVSFLDITHEDYRQANWALITELLEGKRRQFQIEKKYLRKDGSSIWVSNNVSLVPGTERVPRFIMALSEDITQRKRAEEALQRSEAYLAEAQKLAKTGSWAYNPAAEKRIYWSDEMLRIFGLDPQSNLPDRAEFLRLVHPEDRDRFNEQIEKSRREKADFAQDYRIVLTDGTVKHIHGIGHPVLDETGNIVEYVGTDVDVTERKRDEEKLRRSEADLLEAQRLSHTGSWKHELASGKVTVSPEVYRIFDVGPDEVKSTTEFWLNRNHPEDAKRIQELFEESEIQKTDYEADYRIVLPDGTIKHLHAVGHPVLNESGDLVEFVGTAIDVTEQAQARIELEKAFEEIKRLKDRLRDENLALREQIDQAFMFEEIVGSSPALQTVLSSIVKVAPTDSTVLITGETGTGKELIARAIHKRSQRSSNAFISVNCASIPSSLDRVGTVWPREGRFHWGGPAPSGPL